MLSRVVLHKQLNHRANRVVIDQSIDQKVVVHLVSLGAAAQLGEP